MTQEELVKVHDAEFPRCEELTEETREQTKKESSRYRGGVRVSKGKRLERFTGVFPFQVF